jgi:hypothetical protein
MKIVSCTLCANKIRVTNDDILNDVSVYCLNNHYFPARKLVKGEYDPVDLINEYALHQKFKRNCKWLDTAFSSDNVTCLHDDNPTALQVCSNEYCPKKGFNISDFS